MKIHSLKKLALAATMTAWGASASALDIAPGQQRALSHQRAIPSPMLGVTIDSVDNVSQIVESLASLCRKPTARIVFDEVGPEKYVAPVKRIHDVSYVMGEILDSYFVKNYDVEEYVERAGQYVDALSSSVDIWEVGNEINGQWLGDTPTVVAKMTGAYDVVTAKGGRTALTLYHDQSSDGMLWWAQKYVPEHMKQGLDYVFVSFYEDDQGGIKPDWQYVFKRLAEMFPNSKVGFGEVGTRFHSFKKSYISRYYGMKIAQPRYVGGYFWWYFKQDMVPSTRPLLAVLNQAASTGVTCQA
jgi:hypothetical protein